jgi:hypothetical protein
MIDFLMTNLNLIILPLSFLLILWINIEKYQRVISSLIFSYFILLSIFITNYLNSLYIIFIYLIIIILLSMYNLLKERKEVILKLILSVVGISLTILILDSFLNTTFLLKIILSTLYIVILIWLIKIGFKDEN